jgi:ABC-type transport system involved in multi-copper enzyme maturation permease subunit
MMSLFPIQFALADGDSLSSLVLIVGAIIVVVSLFVFGLRDLSRFSIRRSWAIGEVCFRESVRRRVLWVIPLAILGVIVVSQLQRVIDEQDAIRQTTKFCLFAAGLVVVMTTIILACTNLPKEIDNRVIYTVVTKPTTRLELIAGKIIGFSRVSALILIIMGAFTYGYLQLRDWGQAREVNNRLANDPMLSDVDRNMLEHYRDAGLLTAKTYVRASDVEVMAKVPAADDGTRTIDGDNEQEFLFPFTVNRSRMFYDPAFPDVVNATSGMGKTGAIIGLRIKWLRYGPEKAVLDKNSTGPDLGMISVDILNADQNTLVSAMAMYNPKYPGAKEAHTNGLVLPQKNSMDLQGSPGPGQWIWAYVPATQAALFFQQPTIYVHVLGISHNVEYVADGSSVMMVVPSNPPTGMYAPSIPDDAPPPPVEQQILADAGSDGHPAPPIVHGRPASHGGQELAGYPASNPNGPIAIFKFRDAPIAGDSSQPIPLELRAPVDRGGDLTEVDEATTNVRIWVRPAGGAVGPDAPVNLKLDNKLTGYASIPAAATAGGNFDVLVRCDSPGHVMGVDAASLSLVSGHQSFAWNLFKSLFILWMLTVLVVTLSVLSSTFLSWPIALVLTAVLLMGHWCVTQVSDANDKTLGHTFATDWGVTDPARAEALATSVNALAGSLNYIGDLLPDIDRFAIIDDIEKGVVIPRFNMLQALEVLVGFGLPAFALAYLIMKNKEVAP